MYYQGHAHVLIVLHIHSYSIHVALHNEVNYTRIDNSNKTQITFLCSISFLGGNREYVHGTDTSVRDWYRKHTWRREDKVLRCTMNKKVAWKKHKILRDRPFNLQGGVMVFFPFRNFFFGQHESQNIFFFCRAKTLNQTSFSSTKIRIFFQKKKHNPPSPPWKLNGPSLNIHVINQSTDGEVLSSRRRFQNWQIIYCKYTCMS